MTMRQKGIYLCFLIIGIIGSSCNGHIDHNYTCTYHYINQSNQPIRMMIYNLYESDKLIGDYEIAVSNTLSFTLGGDMTPFTPFWFTVFKDEVGDSIYLTFANKRYLTYSKKQKDDIFERKKYRQVEITKYNIVHYWEFTEEDYENATVIEP